MLIRSLLLILSLSFSVFVTADELTLNKDAPKSYIVQKGDTLWDISGIFLNQPWLWPKLWRLNPDINNPHLIYPGDELRLVFDEKGQPMLVRGKPELKWSPRARLQLKDQSAIPSLPLEVIAPYIQYGSVLSEEEIEKLPYILGSDEGYKSSVDGFNVYVNEELDLGRGYGIYQKEGEIYDPETDEFLGYNIRVVGTGKVLRAGNLEDNVPATLYVDGTKQEIRSGDFIIPVNEHQQYPSFFTLTPAHKSLRGLILNSASGLREFGKLEVVMINRGAEHAIEQGDVVSVKRSSPGIVETGGGPIYSQDGSRWDRMASIDDSDYKMPEEVVGEMMIFKVYQQVSLALILRSSKPLRVHDIITSPMVNE
ncbi:MAG: LysM domain-containing protein [Alteromonadaceae bacterium]